MVKVKTVYVCQQCGYQAAKWVGQCPQCKTWNSMVEEIQQQSAKGSKRAKGARGNQAGKVVRLSEVKSNRKTYNDRFTSGSNEFDRVLGGGVVPGSVVLVAGEPGIGKSTLLTQLALKVGQDRKIGVSEKSDNQITDKTQQVLYVCGEESPEQVGLRVTRLQATHSASSGRASDSFDKLVRRSSPPVRAGKRQAFDEKILLLPETDVDVIIETARQEKPGVVIVDSIQTLETTDLLGMTGSVGQVRECASRLTRLAKETGMAVFIVGHVTKSGNVAGPKVLEHMVDCVVELTGERSGLFRILRTLKNRFGATDEVGVFLMEERGLVDVPNPSGVFMEESQAGMPGRALVMVMEGTRPVLVEIQALAVHSKLPQPRRVAQGIPLSKVQVVLAVLTKWGNLSTDNYDVFVSVAGGLRLSEPGADLGIALAVASSITGKALPEKSIAIGEVGLLGEVRQVVQLKKRAAEAKKLGYGQVLAPPGVKHIRQALAGLKK